MKILAVLAIVGVVLAVYMRWVRTYKLRFPELEQALQHEMESMHAVLAPS